MLEIDNMPLVQSGGIYSLAPTRPNTSEISADVILLTNWAKYRNCQCSASRTLLVNASQEQVRVYKVLLGCFQRCVSLLTDGAVAGHVYSEGVEFVKSHDPRLLEYLSPNFGNGVGCKEDEKELEISAGNKGVLRAGMVIELKVGLEGMVDRGTQFAVLLADTILIKSNGKCREILTGIISKAAKDVCYGTQSYIEAPIAEMKLENPKKRLTRMKSENRLELTSRSESHQEALIKQRIESLKKSPLKALTQCTSLYFDNMKQELVIKEKERTSMIKVETIKSVEYVCTNIIRISTLTQEINIRVPNIESACILNEVKSKFQISEQDGKENAVPHIRLTEHILKSTCMRINAADKKVYGSLIALEKGLQFAAPEESSCIVPYKSIKHAFYQACRSTSMILMHLHLHHPIAINTKLTHDVQFYSKVKARNLSVMEGGPVERLIAAVEQLSSTRFKMVQQEKGFMGVVWKSSSLLSPASSCLVNIVNFPFFVVALKDVEVIYFEVLGRRLGNVVLVLQDFMDYVRIECVSSKDIERMKEWITNHNVVYVERKEAFVWEEVLEKLRNKPEDFFFEKEDELCSDEEFVYESGVSDEDGKLSTYLIDYELEYSGSEEFSFCKKRVRKHKAKQKKSAKFDLISDIC